MRFRARVSGALAWRVAVTDPLGLELAAGTGEGLSVDWSGTRRSSLRRASDGGSRLQVQRRRWARWEKRLPPGRSRSRASPQTPRRSARTTMALRSRPRSRTRRRLLRTFQRRFSTRPVCNWRRSSLRRGWQQVSTRFIRRARPTGWRVHGRAHCGRLDRDFGVAASRDRRHAYARLGDARTCRIHPKWRQGGRAPGHVPPRRSCHREAAAPADGKWVATLFSGPSPRAFRPLAGREPSV